MTKCIFESSKSATPLVKGVYPPLPWQPTINLKMKNLIMHSFLININVHIKFESNPIKTFQCRPHTKNLFINGRQGGPKRPRHTNMNRI